jgi:hypothetical protein
MQAETANEIWWGLIQRANEILEVKRAGYSPGDDALQNLRAAETVGVTPIHGVLVRMLDKMTRVGNLVGTDNIETVFANELPDLINYTAILAALLAEKNAEMMQDLRARGGHLMGKVK